MTLTFVASPSIKSSAMVMVTASPTTFAPLELPRKLLSTQTDAKLDGVANNERDLIGATMEATNKSELEGEEAAKSQRGRWARVRVGRVGNWMAKWPEKLQERREHQLANTKKAASAMLSFLFYPSHPRDPSYTLHSLPTQFPDPFLWASSHFLPLCSIHGLHGLCSAI